MDNPQEGTTTSEAESLPKRNSEEVVLSPNALKAILTECLGSWINYLQVLNNLCSAGYKLSQCLGTLAQHQSIPLASQCQSSWEELSKATIIASNSVKTHIAAAMQDMIIGETYTECDSLRQREHNQHIVFENLLTFINLQYQFSIASCECFGTVAMCPCCQTVSGGRHDADCGMATLQQCFARLYTQDMIIGETYTECDSLRQREHNQHIVFENLLTFINLQYQFSIASCECFGTVAMCPCCQTVSGGRHDADCGMATLQQCFARLYTQDLRSQTSSPHSAHPSTLDSPKTGLESRQFLGGPNGGERGSSPSQAADTRGSSPLQAPEMFRGPSPTQSFIDTIRTSVSSHIENLRGPFPTPGALHTMKSPFTRGGSRSPLHFPLFPLSAQRRWSEAAAGDVAPGGPDACARRWSMPWDAARCQADKQEKPATVEPVATCSASITGSDGLAEAIQLLGSRGMRPPVPHQIPPLPLSFCSPHNWTEPQHPEERGMHKRLHQMHSFPRSNWQLQDMPQGTSVTEHYDIFPTNVPLTSRKSSSSTDSSSCLSIHSRSTSGSERGSNSDGGGPEAMRLPSNLYSIWSGSDHLPFIRLPESQEPPDDSEDEKGSMCAFPKPS